MNRVFLSLTHKLVSSSYTKQRRTYILKYKLNFKEVTLLKFEIFYFVINCPNITLM